MKYVTKIIDKNKNYYKLKTYENEIIEVKSDEDLKEGDIIFLLNNNLCVKNKLRTYEGFKNFLKNIKGFGPKSINKIIEYYKEKGIKPHQIRYFFETEAKNEENFHLFNKKQKENIKKFLKNSNKLINEEEFIKENNITTSMVKKLKDKKIDILKQFLTNPYEIAFKIKGIGFKTIDKIALQLKEKYEIFDEEEFKFMRLSAAVFYSLYEGEKEGHVYLAKTGIEYFLKKKLGIKVELVDSEFNKILKHLSNKEEIIIDNFKGKEDIKIVYLKKNYFIEEKSAELLIKKLSAAKEIIDFSEIKTPENIQLSEKQKEAIEKALKENILIITGGPGTGKTTVAKYIYKNLKYYYPNKKIKIMAPTGTAAKRIGSVIGTQATTIHVGLKWKRGYFIHNENNPLDADIVIIDEASMIDLPLFYHLLSALKPETKLILIGDKDQLPPVGIGKPFEDCLLSGIVPTVRLDKVYRQAEDNPIAAFSEEVNKGNTKGEWRYKFVTKNYKPYKELNIIIKKQYNKKENEDYMDNMVNDLIDLFYDIYNNETSDILDIQILAIKNKGKGGVEYINKKIQNLINNNPSIKNTKFKIGDKVIQTWNNYSLNVMNGEIGIIKKVEKNKVIVEYLEGTENNKIIEYSLNKKDGNNYIEKNIELAYAITIHKSQGNEWQNVLILLNDYWMLNRKLIYTGVTRSKNKAIILTNYMNLFKGIETPFGMTEIEINGKKKLVQIKRNSLLDYKLYLFYNSKILKI